MSFYAAKLQSQEGLTKEIGVELSKAIGNDVLVILKAKHTCRMWRGIKKDGDMITFFKGGKYEEEDMTTFLKMF